MKRDTEEYDKAVQEARERNYEKLAALIDWEHENGMRDS